MTYVVLILIVAITLFAVAAVHFLAVALAAFAGLKRGHPMWSFAEAAAADLGR